MKNRILISFLIFLNVIGMERPIPSPADSLDDNSSTVASLYNEYQKCKRKPGYCNHCGSHISNLTRHLREKSLHSLMKCDDCQLTFQNYYFLAAHQVDYWNKHYSCATCTQIFTHQTDFEAHACAHIPIKKEKIEKSKDYSCICIHTFATQSGLSKHKKKCKIYLALLDILAGQS
jgi:hypothetical protein